MSFGPLVTAPSQAARAVLRPPTHHPETSVAISTLLDAATAYHRDWMLYPHLMSGQGRDQDTSPGHVPKTGGITRRDGALTPRPRTMAGMTVVGSTFGRWRVANV